MSTGNIDANQEAAAIAELLRRPERFFARGLTAADFAVGIHHEAVKAAESLVEAGEDVTPENVARQLDRAGKAPPDGSQRAVAELAMGAPVVVDEKRLRALAHLRNLTRITGDSYRLAQAGQLHGALRALEEADLLGVDRAGLQKGSALADVVLESMRDGSREKRITLGMERLAATLGDLPLGSLLVLAADSNVGKSFAALELCLTSAQKGTPSGLISLEDPPDVTGSRLLAAVSGLSSWQIMNARFPEGRDAAFAKLAGGVEKIKRLDEGLLFADLLGESDLEVRAAMSQMAARGTKLIVVDYLQEVASSEPAQDRRNEVRMVAKKLKAHARRLGVVLVLVSQIARPKDGATNTKPSKHALKESGDVTNMAEAIVVLWRQQEDDHAPVNVSIVKSKWGGVGAEWKLERDRITGRLFEV